MGPRPNSALPPSFSIEASPKAISEEPAISSSFGISPLPTVHPALFNVSRFGPPFSLPELQPDHG